MSTPTPTASVSLTPSITASNTPTNTPTGTACPTPTLTATNTATPTMTATQTPTKTPTQTSTQTPSQTATQTSTPTQTSTQTPTNTQTPTPSITASPTQTITGTLTQTPTQTSTQTQTPSQTPTQTYTPTMTPTPLFSCLRAWYDCSDTSTLTIGSGGTISQWNDKSGNGYNLTQSNSSFQPVLSASSLNPQVNFSAVTFNGINQFLSVSGISFTDTGYTYLVVCGINRNENDGFAFSMDGPTSDPTLESNYYLYASNAGSGTDIVRMGADNVNWRWSLESTSADTISRSSGLYFGYVTGITDSTSVAYLNDVQSLVSEPRTTTNTITSIAFGAESGSTPSDYALSEMMELRVFDCVLSQSLLNYHISELKSKWQYSNWLVTPSPTSSPTRTPTMTPTPSITPSQTQTQTPTNTPSQTQTRTPTQTPTLTRTPTPSTSYNYYEIQNYPGCATGINEFVRVPSTQTMSINSFYCLDNDANCSSPAPVKCVGTASPSGSYPLRYVCSYCSSCAGCAC